MNRAHAEGLDIIIGNESDRNTPENGAEMLEWLDSDREQHRELLLSNPEIEPLPAQLQKFVDDICQVYREEFAKLGVELPNQNIQVVQGTNKYFSSIQAADSLQEYEGFIRGIVHKRSGIVVINDLGIPDPEKIEGEARRELTLRYKALIIAHEIYHRLAPVIYRTDRNNNNVHFKNWRMGLAYESDIDKGIRLFALEEGLAETWTDKFRGMVDQAFPLGATLNKNLLLEFGGGYYVDVSNYNTDTGNAYFEHPRYLNCKKLVEYLDSKIPDFNKLAEEARIHGKTDELAVRMEEVFGIGSFNKIVAADENNALELIEQLEGSEKPVI